MSAQAIPSPVENFVVLDLSASYGALIIAAYISCALWGINIMQTYIYYWKMVDTAHKILVTKVRKLWCTPNAVCAHAYTDSVSIFSRLVARGLGRVASTTRHARSWWLWLIFLVLIALVILQIPYCVFSINKPNIFIPINLRIKRAGLISAAVVDVIIAVSMIVLLKDTDSGDDRVYRSKRTSRTMRRLTVIIVNTGLVTAIVATLSLILDETASGTDFWTAIAQYPQCSIYLSAFLANLNARHYIRGEGDSMALSNIEDIHFTIGSTARRDAEESGTILSQLRSGVSQSGTNGKETAGDSQEHAVNLPKYSHSVLGETITAV
ncbi:hypothetical protein B0H15DRAFT_800345 [Mycena belliarum]|uniref:DUF6534 domain-containing protein n=1 Tax=Mycena belliarum TaxID=1033014 RepID=A0AAD6XMS7_9AGAR|nr:hypothetical protein B0H15DRAFT_800345 [Mycena belliae]